MQFLRSPLYFHTSSSGGQLFQTHLGYCSALYKSILPKMYSQPLPRTSLTPSQPPFSHCLSLLLPFFLSHSPLQPLRVLAPACSSWQCCSKSALGDRGRRNQEFSLWDFTAPLRNSRRYFGEPNSKLGHPHAHRRWERTDSAQKRKVHHVQAELVQLWVVGSSGHALGKERRNKTFLPTVSVPCD